MKLLYAPKYAVMKKKHVGNCLVLALMHMEHNIIMVVLRRCGRVDSSGLPHVEYRPEIAPAQSVCTGNWGSFTFESVGCNVVRMSSTTE